MKWIRKYISDPFAVIVPQLHFVQFLPAIASAVGSIGGALMGKQKAPKAAEAPSVDAGAETRKALDFNLENLGDISKLSSLTSQADQANALAMIEQALPGFGKISSKFMEAAMSDLDSSMTGRLPKELESEILRSAASNNLATGARGQAGDFNVARNLGLGALDYQNMLRQRSLQTLSQIHGMAPKINPMSTTAMMLTPQQAIAAKTGNEQSRYMAQQSDLNAQAAASNNNAGLAATAFQGVMGAIGGAPWGKK